MKKIKLIACDLDGTLLLNGAQELNPEIYDLILQLKQKDILFVAASGRQYLNLRRLFAPVQDDIAYIAENGALCYYQNELLRERFMERAVGESILKEIRRQPHCEILLSGKETCYLESSDEEYIYHMTQIVKNHVTLVDDVLAIQEPYYKISAYDQRGIDRIQPIFLDKFKEQVHVVVSGNAWLDMLSYDSNKGDALAHLACHMGIRGDECAAFGDNFNDLQMLAFAGESYSMTHAAPAIHQASKYVIPRVEDQLKEILLYDE